MNRFMAGKGIQCPLNTKLPTKNTEIWITMSRELADLKVVNKVNSRPKFLKKKTNLLQRYPVYYVTLLNFF